MTIKKLHQWIGLAIAVYLGFQCTTGILLLYRVDLQTLFDGQGSQVLNSDDSIRIQTVLQNIRLAYPTAVIERIDYPSASGGAYIAHLAATDTEPGTKIAIDPATGDIRAAPAVIKFFAAVVALHHELALGPSGRYIVGTLGLMLLTSSLSGLWIWWPGIKRIRKSLRIVTKGGGVRAYFSLHRTVGVIVLFFIVIASSTGLLLAFGEVLRPIFGVSFAPKPVATLMQPAGVDVDSVDRLLDSAQGAVPNAGIRDLRFRRTPNQVSRVVMYRDGERDWTRGPYQQAWVEPATGKLTGVLDSRDLTAGQSVFLWLYPIHTSLGLGYFGKLLAAIGGLGILILCVTGPMLWWKRRQLSSRAV